jgi:hypothetical protein
MASAAETPTAQNHASAAARAAEVARATEWAQSAKSKLAAARADYLARNGYDAAKKLADELGEKVAAARADPQHPNLQSLSTKWIEAKNVVGRINAEMPRDSAVSHAEAELRAAVNKLQSLQSGR